MALFIILLLHTVSAQDAPHAAWRDRLPSNEIRFSIGDVVTPVLFSDHVRLNWLGFYPDMHYPSDWFTNANRFSGDIWSTGALSFGYRYRITKWFWLGADINYTGFFGFTDNHYASYNESMFTLLPTARFSYLNRPFVTLYSQIALGYTWDLLQEGSSYSFDGKIGYQLTFIGINFGKEFFGSAEIGCGFKGFLNAGFGYKF